MPSTLQLYWATRLGQRWVPGSATVVFLSGEHRSRAYPVPDQIPRMEFGKFHTHGGRFQKACHLCRFSLNKKRPPSKKISRAGDPKSV